MCVVEHVPQLMIVNAGSLQFIFCFGKAVKACIHLDQAIFVEPKSMLILLLPAQHCFSTNCQRGKASETSRHQTSLS